MYHITPVFRRLLILLLFWFLRIQMMSSITTTPTEDDNASAQDHQECPVMDPVPTNATTSNHITDSVEHSPNPEERVRFVVIPDRAVLEDILLRYYGTSRDTLYHDDDDDDDDVDPTTLYQETCRRMVEEELSVEEQQIAACTSYAYWAYEQYLKNAEPPPSEADLDVVRQSLRIQMAMREAYRHYVGQNYHYQNTVTRLKQTIQWRKDARIDLLKIAFASATTLPSTTTTIPIRWTDSNTTQLLRRYERWIPSDLRIQTMAVRGFDREHRPIVIRQSRQQPWQNQNQQPVVDHNDSSEYLDQMEEGFEWSQLYMVERALAITEIHSRGTCHQVSVCLDYTTTYQSQHAPPISVMIRIIVQVLQNHYPERLGRAVFVQAPFWMTTIMKIILPLIATKTREKVVFIEPPPSSSLSSWLPSTVNNLLWGSTTASASAVENAATTKTLASDDSALDGDGMVEHGDNDAPSSTTITQREAKLSAIVDADQAMLFMRSDGQLRSPIDIMYQLYQVPFYEIYDFQNVGKATEAHYIAKNPLE